MDRTWAVVTGASGGIGEAIAHRLAARGHALVLVARSGDKLDALAATLARGHGIETRTIALDLGAHDAADRVATELADAGIVPAILINNAGFGLYGKHADTALDDEQAMLDLNIVALTRLTKRLLPGMLAARRGRIVNVASTAAFQPGPYMAVYFATKAYVLSYSEALAEELAGTGITVTALCPGPTTSGFQDRAAMHASGLLKHGTMARVEDVADYALRAMDRGQRVAIHGVANKVMTWSLRFLPRRTVAKLVASLSKPV